MAEIAEAPPVETGKGTEKDMAAIFERLAPTEVDPNAPPAAPAPEPARAPDPAPVKAPEPMKNPVMPPDVLLDAAPKPVAEDISMPDEPPAAIRGEKERADYKKWRGEWKQLKQDYDQLREKSAHTQTSTAPLQEVEDLRATNKQLQDRLMQMSPIVERAGLEQHPAFQQQFVAPRAELLGEVKEVAELAGIEYEYVEQALSLSGKQRIEALDELTEQITSPTLRNRLDGVIFAIDKLDKQKNDVMRDVKGSIEQFDQQERIRRHENMQRQEKRYSTLVDSVAANLGETFEFLKESAGNEEWNAGIKERINIAKHLVTKNTDESQLITAAVLATMTQNYRGAWLQERELRLAAEKENAEFKSSTPRLGGGNGTAIQDDPSANPVSRIINRLTQQK